MASTDRCETTAEGPFATPLGDFGHAWVSFNESEPNWPDIQLLMVSSGLPQEGILAAVAIGLDQRKYHQYFAGLAGRQTMTMMPYLARPKSRGAIYLRSKRPLDRQVIDPKYLSHPDDIAAFLKGIGLAMNISRTSPFVKNLGTRFHARPLDDCKDRALGSREYWVCYIQHMASTFYHFAGSCKMGPATDPKSVVDEELKVRGVYGVRVIDASVMPTVVSANLMASTIMIAEKAADKIKEKLANQARSADYVLYNWLDSQSVDDLFEENLAELQVEVSQFVQEYPTENYSR
ncbi:hypothetical protein SK128_022645 [Halocaridina rubra]|uniref:Glucose-methanol-choline oxidoreductase C-terminal domain-containing protein n=1 Tax=Halocaridina rubra TaxID=373956 RepID=A0AAN9AE49_HALRR